MVRGASRHLDRDARQHRALLADPDADVLNRALPDRRDTRQRGGHVCKIDVKTGGPFLRLLDVGRHEASRRLQRDCRGCAAALHLQIADDTGGTDAADDSRSRAVETIRLDEDDIAGAADARTDWLYEIDADARYRRAIECTSVLHAHACDRHPRIDLEVVSEADRDDVAHFNHKRARVGLRRDVGNRVGGLDGDDACTVVDTRSNPLEHCGVGAGGAKLRDGDERDHRAEHHERPIPKFQLPRLTPWELGIGSWSFGLTGSGVHYLPSSLCRSTLRTSRCFSSDSGSVTCCAITMLSGLMTRMVPSSSLSPALTT